MLMERHKEDIEKFIKMIKSEEERQKNKKNRKIKKKAIILKDKMRF